MEPPITRARRSSDPGKVLIPTFANAQELLERFQIGRKPKPLQLC
jgi:hypothetical protein